MVLSYTNLTALNYIEYFKFRHVYKPLNKLIKIKIIIIIFNLITIIMIDVIFFN